MNKLSEYSKITRSSTWPIIKQKPIENAIISICPSCKNRKRCFSYKKEIFNGYNLEIHYHISCKECEDSYENMERNIAYENYNFYYF